MYFCIDKDKLCQIQAKWYLKILLVSKVVISKYCFQYFQRLNNSTFWNIRILFTNLNFVTVVEDTACWEKHIHESDVNEGIYIYLTNSYSLFHTATVTELYVMLWKTVCLLSISHTIQTKPDLPTMLIRGKNYNLHAYLCNFWTSRQRKKIFANFGFL